MTTDTDDSARSLVLSLDPRLFAQLELTAAERGQAPAELVAGWVRERLAHEAERKQGHAREQRPHE